MKKVELEIIALSHSITQSHSYAVVLGEVGGSRRLPVVIGGFEAQAIAVAIEKMNPSRPLTHDLMKNICETFNIKLKEIIINNLVDGIFYAKLVCEKSGESMEIDSRTSDALALAVRYDCPIFTYEFILDSAGIVLEEKEGGTEKRKAAPSAPEAKKSFSSAKKEDIQNMSLTELNSLLQNALEKEDYEGAIKYRDEITRRKKGS